MIRSLRSGRLFLFLIFILHGFAGCGSSGGGGGGLPVTTCEAGQLSCYMSNLVIQDEAGNKISLVQIPGPLPATVTGNSMTPEITGMPDSHNVTDPDFLVSHNIDWTDPLGARPALCIRLCSNSICTGVVTEPYGCAHSIPDGLISGTWRTFLGYRAEPAGSVGTTENFFFELTPISMPGGQDPVQFFKNMIDSGNSIENLGTNESVYAGKSRTNPHSVKKSSESSGSDSDSDSDGSGSGGTSCGPPPPIGFGNTWWNKEYVPWCKSCGGTPNVATTSCDNVP